MKASLLFLFSLSVLMWSCSSTDHFFNDAKVYEQNNMPLEAIKNYERSYRQNDNVEAHVALKNLSVRYAESELAQVKIALQSKRFEEAERSLTQLQRFNNEYQWLNLDLTSRMDQSSKELNAAWSENLYENAYQSVLSERYDDADIYIHQLEKKSPNYPELDYLKSLRIIIPNYNKGEKAFELELFREAMNFYAEVLSIDADYKNALERFNECLSKVRFSLSIVLKKNESIPDALERSISAEIKQGIIELNDKSIELVDRENIDDLLAEQLLGMGAGFGENISGEAGELIGAQYIIIGEFVTYRVRSSPERRYERKGYLGPSTNDQKVNYYYYEREDHMEASFRFVMVETATGKVIAADNVPYVESEKIAYARFNGNAQRLYPGNWRTKLLGSRMDEVYTEQKPALDELLQNNIGGSSEVGFQQKFTELIASRISEMMLTFTSNR
jgi:tetratricopeptide (TPR) repeat protein